MSIPVTPATWRAKAHATTPPPHATSRTVSLDPAPLVSMISSNAVASVIVPAVLKGVA
jgi:hypothetical protein